VTCRDCGGELPSRRHRYCDDCRQRRWEKDARRGRQSAGQVLAVLRAEKRDPGHGGRAAARRGAKTHGTSVLFANGLALDRTPASSPHRSFPGCNASVFGQSPRPLVSPSITVRWSGSASAFLIHGIGSVFGSSPARPRPGDGARLTPQSHLGSAFESLDSRSPRRYCRRRLEKNAG
jgi:hypothetical protein